MTQFISIYYYFLLSKVKAIAKLIFQVVLIPSNFLSLFNKLNDERAIFLYLLGNNNELVLPNGNERG